jgi:hypothetical protein
VSPTATLEAVGGHKNDFIGHQPQLADLDGDGILDLVCGGFSSSPFGILDAGAGYAWFGGTTLSGTVRSPVRFAVTTATTKDFITEPGSGLRGFCLVDLTNDGILDFIASGRQIDWAGVMDVGAFHFWRGGFSSDSDPDVTLYVPGAHASDRVRF